MPSPIPGRNDNEREQELTRNLKTLGLALVAALAISAVMASAASATEFWLRSDGTPTTLKGTMTVPNGNVLTFDYGTFSCESINSTGEMTGTTVTTLTLKFPETLETCKAGGVKTILHFNGCDFLLHTHTKTGTPATYHLTTTIVCPPNKEITLTWGFPTVKCTIHVPPQTIATGVSLTNSHPNILADINITTGITYSQTPGTGAGACPTADNTSNGSYTGQDRFEGFNAEGASTTIWVE